MESQQNHSQNKPWKLIHPESFHNTEDPHVDLKNLHGTLHLIKLLDMYLWWGFIICIFYIPFKIASFKNKNTLTWTEFKCLMITAQYKRKYYQK